jgi:hypothetical protein
MMVRSAVSCIDDAALDELHVARNVAHHVKAALLPWVNRATQERQRRAWERHGLEGEPHQHHMTAHPGTVPRLLHGLHIGWIRLRFHLRWKGLEPGRLYDEVRAARHHGVARASPRHAAGEAAIVGAAAQLPHALDDAVALRHRIERGRGAELQRQVATVLDGIDRNHLTCAHHSAGLHRAEPDRAHAKDRHGRPRLKVHVGVARGEARG